MPTNYFHLFVLMLTNLSDIVIFYLLPYKFFDKKPPFLKQHIWGGVIYGIGIGVLAYYIGGSYLFQITITIIPILMLIYLHKEKYQFKFSEIMVLYFLCILTLLSTRLPITVFLFAFNLHISILFLLVVVIQMIVLLWLRTKNWLTKFYEGVICDIFLQILIAITVAISLSIWTLLTFEASATHLIFYILLFAFTLISLYQIIPMIYFHTKDLPRLLHDRNTELMAHHARVHTDSKCKKAKASVNAFMEKADMSPKADEYVIGKYQDNIDAFIDKRIDYHVSPMRFKKCINYSEPHKTVEYDELLYMIGILIDNAIESGRSSLPSFITISCVHAHLFIEQSNAILSAISQEKITKMMQVGASTKARYGRGYGLYNLNQVIKNYGGTLEITSSYDTELKSDYLMFRIIIGVH